MIDGESYPVPSLFDPEDTPEMPDDEIPTEPQWTPTQKQIIELNKANNEILKRLGGMGLNIDPTGQRFEMFTEMLVEAGIASAEAMEAFNLRWVEFFNNYLVQTEVRVRAQIEAQIEHARRAQAQARLGVGQSAGIVVPGNGGRANGTGRRRRG